MTLGTNVVTPLQMASAYATIAARGVYHKPHLIRSVAGPDGIQSGEVSTTAVVSVSAVSRWYVRDTGPMRRVHWLLETAAGGLAARPLVRLRLEEAWRTPPPSPLAVVHRIAPIPLLLVHGDRDEYFPVEHFRTLVVAAGSTATAWVVPGFGHAESGATAPLVERIARWVSATIDP